MSHYNAEVGYFLYDPKYKHSYEVLHIDFVKKQICMINIDDKLKKYICLGTCCYEEGKFISFKSLQDIENTKYSHEF